MAKIELRKPLVAGPPATKGWRSGKDSRDRAKLTKELTRLEDVINYQSIKIEGYAGLYNRLLKWMEDNGHDVAADRLRTCKQQIDTESKLDKKLMKGTN